MEQIITSIIVAFLIILEIVLYFILSATVLPKIVKIKCSVRSSTDRGLKKYIYPSGRAISYEPHPSVRKYIQRYILFTNDGYKYIKCRLDRGIDKLVFSVVMFNNENRVIDVLELTATNKGENETRSVLLHQDTSYVSVAVDSVNGNKMFNEVIMECRLWRLWVYSLSIAALNFLQLIFTKDMIALYDKWFFKSGIANSFRVEMLLFASFGIAAVSGAIVFLKARGKRVRWRI